MTERDVIVDERRQTVARIRVRRRRRMFLDDEYEYEDYEDEERVRVLEARENRKAQAFTSFSSYSYYSVVDFVVVRPTTDRRVSATDDLVRRRRRRRRSYRSGCLASYSRLDYPTGAYIITYIVCIYIYYIVRLYDMYRALSTLHLSSHSYRMCSLFCSLLHSSQASIFESKSSIRFLFFFSLTLFFYPCSCGRTIAQFSQLFVETTLFVYIFIFFEKIIYI